MNNASQLCYLAIGYAALLLSFASPAFAQQAANTDGRVCLERWTMGEQIAALNEDLQSGRIEPEEHSSELTRVVQQRPADCKVFAPVGSEKAEAATAGITVYEKTADDGVVCIERWTITGQMARLSEDLGTGKITPDQYQAELVRVTSQGQMDCKVFASVDSDAASEAAATFPVHDLVDYGFYDSTKLRSVGNRDFYKAELPRDSYSGTAGDTVFVVVHRSALDAPLFELEEVRGQPGVSRFGKGFRSSSIFEEVLAHIDDPAHNRATVYHYVAGAEIPEERRYRVSTPVVPVIVARDGDDNTVRVYSAETRVSRFRHKSETPAASAESRIASLRASKAGYERRTALKLVPTEQTLLIENARAQIASRHGHIHMPRSDWASIVGTDGPTALESYFAGQFEEAGNGLQMQIQLVQFANFFSSSCKQYLKPGFETVVIVTTTKWINVYGNEVGLPREERSNIYVDRELAPFYRPFWENLNSPRPVSLPETIANAMLFLQRPGMFGSLSDAMKASPAIHNRGFFSTFACDSPEMQQLRQNLKRLVHGEGSLQATRTAVPGLRPARKGWLRPGRLPSLFRRQPRKVCGCRPAAFLASGITRSTTGGGRGGLRAALLHRAGVAVCETRR